MPKRTVLQDAYLLDDAGHLVWSMYVDFRDSADRAPTTLVKGCKKNHAVETYRKIRITKPSRFREYGEGLIRDTGEAYASQASLQTRTTSNALHLPEVRLLVDAIDTAGDQLQSKIEIEKLTTKESLKTTDSVTFGKNGWIFCTSVAPEHPTEEANWRRSLPDDYDHISRIYRPRHFARALGSMVADQLGPRGQVAEVTHPFGDGEETATYHKSQLVFHGPVVYVEDPFSVISKATSEQATIFLPIFTKGMKYKNQREYRFVVWSEEEPTDETVDLDVSLSMLEAMQSSRKKPFL